MSNIKSIRVDYDPIMTNLDYFFIEIVESYKNTYCLERVVALYKDEYFHWVDSDGTQSSLHIRFCNIQWKVLDVYKNN